MEQDIEEIVIVRGVISMTEYTIDHVWKRDSIENLNLYKLPRLGKMHALVTRYITFYDQYYDHDLNILSCPPQWQRKY
jgi:hypothetical protein